MKGPDEIALFPHSNTRGQIMAFISVTRLRLRYIRFFPPFLWWSVEWRTGEAGARKPESYRTARLAPHVLDTHGMDGRARHASLHAVRSSPACDAKAIQLVRRSIGCSL